MVLAIPNAPRAVKLQQVPGAVRRLSAVAGAAAVGVLLLWWLGAKAGGWLSSERAFFELATEVKATVLEVRLPPPSDEAQGARLTVLYTWDGRERSVSGVETSAQTAREVRSGSPLTVLLDPAHPEAPREAKWAQEGRGLHRFTPFGLGLGLLLAAALIAFELRRAIRNELLPLKTGLLVWLTPDDELPATRAETVFAASYYRQDVKYQVRARARPGRAPVKNGGKVLAAVVPSRPTLVRVIDEDLARELGWFK